MKRLIIFAAAALVLVTSNTAHAGLKLFGALAYVSPLSESDQNVGGVTDAVKASSEAGFNFGVEFRPSPLIGIELDYLYANHDIDHNTAGLLGETTFQPISATLNLHVPVGTVDLYGGPTASYVNWGDLKLPAGAGEQKIDAEFGYGISVGADFNLIPTLAVTGGLRWLNLKAQPDGSSESLDVHPLFARIGVAFKL